MISVTLVNDGKSELGAGFGRANPGFTLAQIKAADAASNNGSVAGFLQLAKAVTFLGGPDQVVPGATESAVVDMSKPGLYGFSLSSR